MPDEEIFARAIDERRVILTFDLDFGRFVFDSRALFPSISIYRPVNARAHRQIERLMAALRVATSPLEAGALVIVDDMRVRMRELPIAKLPRFNLPRRRYRMVDSTSLGPSRLSVQGRTPPALSRLVQACAWAISTPRIHLEAAPRTDKTCRMCAMPFPLSS